MLKTNNKKVVERIKNYIIESFNFECANDIEGDSTNFKMEDDFELVCNYILEVCFDCQLSNIHYDKKTMLKHFYKDSYYQCFKDWIYGLPSLFDLGYCYLASAKDLIKEWLEETEEEASKYSEDEAEELATKLIFRELTKNINLYQIINK